MQKKVRTVLGDILPEQMGYTSMHDHTFLDLQTAADYLQSIFFGVQEQKLAFIPENYDYLKTGTFLLCKDLQVIDDLEGLEREYLYFKELGGNTVVDAAPSAPRGDIRKMAELSRRTGLNIICATGIYHDTAIPAELKHRDLDFYYRYMKQEIDEGIDGTDIRPGMLKGALNTCSETEQNVVEACIKLSAETGMSAHIHTEPTVDGDDLLSIVSGLTAKYSLSPERVHICHMDNRIVASTMVMDFLEDFDTQRTLDLDIHKKLLDQGFSIGLDTWGMPIHNPNMFMPDDFDRLKALITLIDLGYGNQITLGNDFSSKIEWRAFGGSGCTRFAEFGGQLMEMMGRDDQYHKLVCENPMRIMQF